MFAYCCNNAVNGIDKNGQIRLSIISPYDLRRNRIDEKALDIAVTGLRVILECFSSEHKKKGTTNPAHRNKHENGAARKNRDAGHEKGDERRNKNPNKRNNYEPQSLLFGGGMTMLATAGIATIIADDVTVIGAVDDFLLIPIVIVLIEGTCVK